VFRGTGGREIEEPGTANAETHYFFASTRGPVDVRAGAETEVSISASDFEDGRITYFRAGFDVEGEVDLLFTFPVRYVAATALSADEGYIYAVSGSALFEGEVVSDPEEVTELKRETDPGFPDVNSLSMGVLPDRDSILVIIGDILPKNIGRVFPLSG